MFIYPYNFSPPDLISAYIALTVFLIFIVIAFFFSIFSLLNCIANHISKSKTPVVSELLFIGGVGLVVAFVAVLALFVSERDVQYFVDLFTDVLLIVLLIGLLIVPSTVHFAKWPTVATLNRALACYLMLLIFFVDTMGNGVPWYESLLLFFAPFLMWETAPSKISGNLEKSVEKVPCG